MPDLIQMIEGDQQNIQASIETLQQYGVYGFYEELPVLFDELLPAIQQHLPENYFPFSRQAADGTEVPTYDFILRVCMLQSVHQQFVLAVGHLLRGHVSEVYGHMRRAIEGAGIAHHSKTHPELGEMFISEDTTRFRNNTHTGTILPRNDPMTGRLNESIGYASQMLHSNFISFVNRHESSIHMEDDRWTFSAQLNLYEGDLQFFLNTSLWAVRIMVRVLQLVAVSFDLPACEWHQKLEQLYDREEQLRLRLEPLINPDYQEPESDGGN
jgi:hypothetical protein